jgi:transposase
VPAVSTRWRRNWGATGTPSMTFKLANTKLDECRRRVQNETLGHRGHKADPLYRCRRLLTKAEERLDEKGREKLMGLLRAGDPNGDVATVWQIGGRPRALCPRRSRPRPPVGDPAGHGPDRQGLSRRGPITRANAVAVEARDRCLAHRPCEQRSDRGGHQPDQAGEAGIGFRHFRHYRVRALLYAGKPDWSLLGTVRPAVG